MMKNTKPMILDSEEPSILQAFESALITEESSPASYLVNVEDYEFKQKRLRLLEGIARGERAIQQGRVVSQTDAEAKLQKWLT